MGEIVVGFLIAVAVFSLGMLYRNERVYRFRISILDDIKPEDPKFWEKLSVIRSVTYFDMMNAFWKPLKLESFFSQEQIKTLTSND